MYYLQENTIITQGKTKLRLQHQVIQHNVLAICPIRNNILTHFMGHTDKLLPNFIFIRCPLCPNNRSLKQKLHYIYNNFHVMHVFRYGRDTFSTVQLFCDWPTYQFPGKEH